MKILINTFKKTGNLHHAYILEGEKELIRKNLIDFIEKYLKHETKGNPDFWHGQFESFSIDDARKLRDRQSQKALSDGRKIFVIETLTITVEAQNALLKVFEEPTSGTHFFIITPSAHVFLPTLRSRVVIIARENEEIKNSRPIQEFVTMTPSERLKFVADIIENKNKEQAIELVEGLIIYARSKKYTPETMTELIKIRGYLNDRSPSLKLSLEHAAMII